MSEVLGCMIPRKEMRRLTAAQIFRKYASHEQQDRAEEFYKRYWNITLCREEIGFDFLHLDEPIQDAAEVLEVWSEEYHIVYLTGRIEATRKSTLSQLEVHGFPIEGNQLVMFQSEDYDQTGRALGTESVGLGLTNIRSKYFSMIVQQNSVLKVVDDFPSYFSAYRKHNIPDLIGIMSSPQYKEQSFLDQGASRVIRCWRELLFS